MADDFYLSACAADQGWAEWLAFELEEAGHRVVHFPGRGGGIPGDRILEMQQGLARASRLLLVISIDAVVDDHAQREWRAALSRPPEELLPVQVRAGEIRGALLPQVSPVVLHGVDEAEARRRFAAALAAAPVRPSQRPPFPAAPPPPRSVPSRPRFPGATSVLPTAMPLNPGTLLHDTWVIERPIGHGGMGEVLLARHRRLSRRVAVKVLRGQAGQDPQAVRRFFNEAEIVARLDHPGTVKVDHFGELPDGAPYLVMEYLDGETLAARLARSPGGLGAAGLALCEQLADVLDQVHREGVVHRDLKPSNLMIVADAALPGGERLKVLDFGVAKASGDASAGTASNVPLGTAAYMAPEQFQSAATVTAAADLYAFGLILFEVLTGRAPFQAATFHQWTYQHCFQPAPALPAPHPAALATLCAQLLDKQADRRPSAAAVAAALRAARTTPAPVPPPPPVEPPPERPEQPTLPLADKPPASPEKLTPPPALRGPIAIGVGAALVLAVVARLAVGSGQSLPQMDAGVAPTPASGAPVLRSAPDLASAIALPSDEPPPKPRTQPDLASAIIVPE